MSSRAIRIERAARALVGVPFRLQGQCAQTGLDCVGLVQQALAGAGCRAVAPDHYSVRGGRFAAFDTPLRQAGLRRVRTARSGDIVLVQAGVEQFHLMIAVAGGHVHAHAGLGRVVEMPGASPWPVIARWRWGR